MRKHIATILLTALFCLTACATVYQQPYAQDVGKAGGSKILVGDLQLINVPPQHAAALQAEWTRAKPEVLLSLQKLGFESQAVSAANLIPRSYEVLGRRALEIDRQAVTRSLGGERLLLVPVAEGESRFGSVARGYGYCPGQRWMDLSIFYVVANQEGLVLDSNDFGQFPVDQIWKVPEDGSRLRIPLSELEVTDDRRCRMVPLKQVNFENRLNSLNLSYTRGLKK